ncbi:lactosylceramide 4-alpha-galactosyltransferase-like [Amblyomma americanum]
MRSDFLVALLCLGIFTLVVDVVLEALPTYLIAMAPSGKPRKGPHSAGDLDGSFFFAGARTSRCLGHREACAVEAAARHHRTTRVVLFLDGPHRSGGHGVGIPLSDCRTLEALLAFANVRVRRIHLDDLFARTPLRYWRAQSLVGRHSERLSDAVRFALLWKHGGVYADLDVIVKKPLDGLRNCLGERGTEEADPAHVSGAVLVFEKGHPLMELCMEEMARQYQDSRLLIPLASGAIARTLRDHYVCGRHESAEFPPARELRCADGRSRVTVLPRDAFFAVEAYNETRHFGAAPDAILQAAARSYAVRAGRFPARSARGADGTSLESEARRHCPRIYRLVERDGIEF